MKLIIGLGNPGDKYIKTRHNAGFIFADALALKLGIEFKFESKFNAEIAKTKINDEQLFIVKPQTFMNLSGYSVIELTNFYKLTSKDIIVVYDDISLNLGTIRFRPKGSDGGHNGIKSIIMNIATDCFDRLKIGIGPQPTFLASEAYVLQTFSKDEIHILSEVIIKSIEAIEYYLEYGITDAQNKYN